MFSSCSRFLLLVLAFAVPLSAEVLKIEEGISIELLDDWSVLPRRYRNVVEIVNVPAEKQTGLYPVRASIGTERRRSHDESLRRLTEIAQEWKGQIDSIVVDGWPALIRRYDYPLPRRGQNAGEGKVISPSMTIAVAYGARVLRIEAHLLPDADRSLLDVMAKYAGRIRLDGSAGFQPAASRLQPGRPRTGRLGSLRPDGGEGKKIRTLAAPGVPDRIRNNNRGELEIAVSRDGRDIVVATNLGYSFSNDGGDTFADGGGAPIANEGDPSVTWGRSGRFYWAFIGLPADGCSTAIATSVNRGRNFFFTANATFCPTAGAGVCFPDQEHIAADRINPGSDGDQVYSVWRNFVPMGAFGSCDRLGAASPSAALVCSQNSAENWTDAIAVDPAGGDFPRVAVGGNGAVYVTYHAGALIMLNKFSSCADGLAQQEGFPVVVTGFAGVPCPVSGLDRCNDGNLLASPTVAIDERDPNHVFLAIAEQTAAGNEDVIVFESADGGATWPRSTPANAPVPGRRFMPWMCSADSRAFVGWYDRRASAVEGATRDDLTEYFLGEVLVRGGSLVREVDRNLSNAPDPQCDSRWPCGVRQRSDAEACPMVPTAGTGECIAFGRVTGECDVTRPACLSGVCMPKGGCPKYGDYNGIACTGDTVYVAWTSATAPAGAEGPSRGLDVYTERIVVRAPPSLPICRRVLDCVDVFEMQRGLLRLLCPSKNCFIIDPLPKNCQVKFPCPGCSPGLLCPPFYEITLEGIDKSDFKVQLTDFEGHPVQHKVRSSNGRTIVSFRPEKENFREGDIGDYLLVFTPGPKHVPGKIYDVKTSLERK